MTRYIKVQGAPIPLPAHRDDASLMDKVKHWIFLATRNRILDDPIDLFENHDSTRTQLLHEYFIPRDSLEAFLVQARKIIPAHAGDLLNLTVRSLRADSDAVLAYARQDVFSLVMLYSQRTNAEGEKSMAAAFFALKRKCDPEEIFQNKFYQEYGHPAH